MEPATRDKVPEGALYRKGLSRDRLGQSAKVAVHGALAGGIGTSVLVDLHPNFGYLGGAGFVFALRFGTAP